MNRPTYETTPGCCSEFNCEHGLRNNYFEGKRLTADSFRVEQKYSLDRRRLLNRAIHGWGVVYGYSIKAGGNGKAGQLTIGAGFALDKCGRELIQTEQPIELKELIVLDENGVRIDRELAVSPGRIERSSRDGEYCWRLSVHYAERPAGPVKVKDPCQCEFEEWDRTCETVRYSLQRILCDECCDDQKCELECECSTGPCCGEPTVDDRDREKEREREREKHRQIEQERERRIREQDRERLRDEFAADPDSFIEVGIENLEDLIEARIGSELRQTETPSVDVDEKPVQPKRGGCRCLCEHVIKQDPGKDCGVPCEIEEPCGSVWVDLKNGVPIACVKLIRDECDRLTFEDVDECGPRRLVKGNDLLFDLIRGCDLTRISDFGWKSWHRESVPIDFNKDFAPAFGPVGSLDDGCVTRDFWVEFSRPVRSETVRRDCFVMTVIFSEHHDGWWETYRVPIERIERDDTELIDRATIVVSRDWYKEIFGPDATSLFQGKTTRIEIEVRGDFIVDCNGQTVDANPHGHRKVPTGNGTPGGTFLSTFLVDEAPKPTKPPQSYREDRNKGVS